MSRGGRREGAGRPRGAEDKNPRVTVKALLASEELCLRVLAKTKGMLPLPYMLKVMNDRKQPADRRDRMAIAASPFCHARLVYAELKRPSVMSEDRARARHRRRRGRSVAPRRWKKQMAGAPKLEQLQQYHWLLLAELTRRRGGLHGMRDREVVISELLAVLDQMAVRLRADPRFVKPDPEESREAQLVRWLKHMVTRRRPSLASIAARSSRQASRRLVLELIS